MWKGFEKKTIMLNGNRTEVLAPTRALTHEQAWKEMKPILDRIIARMRNKQT